MAAAAVAAAAPPAVHTGARISSPPPRSSLVLLPPLPRRSTSTSTSTSTSSVSHLSDACRVSSLQVRATSSSEEASTSTDELLSDLKEKWDAIENKSTVFLYGGGAIVAVWLSSVVVGAINSVPLLPKVMELVGLGYTGWFVYRCLLFKIPRPGTK